MAILGFQHMGMSTSDLDRAVAFASGVVPECGPLDTIRAAEEGGFNAVGLWVEPAIWTSRVMHETRNALAASGLEPLDIEVIWLKPGSDLDEHRRCIDIGAALGAKNVLCVSSDPDLAATAVLDLVAHPLGALLIDPLHLDRSGGTVAEIAAIPPELLSYAQFCDTPAGRRDPQNFDAVIHDALDLRCQAGDGSLPLHGVFEALPVDIPLSIELRSKALRDQYPHPGQRAPITAQATRAWLRAVEERVP